MTRMETMENIGKPIGFVVFLSVILHPYTYTSKSLNDKMVLLTDASSILGEEMAYQYCKVKTRIMLVATDQQKLNRTAETCKDLGAIQVETMAGDLANATFRQKLVEEVERRIGGLDHLLMNHQAQLEPAVGYSVSPTDGKSTLDRVMELEFTSYVDLASRALPMLERTKGKIGIVSSLVGRIPVANLAPYSASRAALLAFFPALRQELYQRRSGVTTTLISLGYTRSKTEGNALSKHNPFFNNRWTNSLEDVAETAIINVELLKQEISYPFLSQVHSALYYMIPNFYEKHLLTPYLSMLP